MALLRGERVDRLRQVIDNDVPVPGESMEEVMRRWGEKMVKIPLNFAEPPQPWRLKQPTIKVRYKLDE